MCVIEAAGNHHASARRLALCAVAFVLNGLIAPRDAAGVSVEIATSTPQVGRYERIDFAIRVDKKYKTPWDMEEVYIDVEFETPSGPSLWVPAFIYQDYERRSIESPGNMKDWLYPVGDMVWKARFAPMETGAFKCHALLRDGDGGAESGSIEFECVPSTSPGFIRASAKNPRYLEFTNGRPFFAIGQDFAFVKDTFREEELFGKFSAAGGNYTRVWAAAQDWAMTIEGRKSAYGRSWAWRPPFSDIPGAEGDEGLQKCVKIGTASEPQTRPIVNPVVPVPEAANDEKSDLPQAPVGSRADVVDVNPSHPVALRPNTHYVITGSARTRKATQLWIDLKEVPVGEPIVSEEQWSEFKREFTTAPDQWWLEGMRLRITGDGAAYVKVLSLKEAVGGPELLWEADVNRPPLGCYNLMDCFMLDKVMEAAERTGIRVQLVVMPRGGYLPLIKNDKKEENTPDYAKALRYARKIMRYAVGRWGYSTNLAAWEYFNEMDPNAPTDRFYKEIGKYMEQIDPYHHLRTTSSWHPSPRDWKLPQLDTDNLHPYMRQVQNQPWEDEVAFVLEKEKDALAAEPKKPVLFSEFGLAAEGFGKSPYLAKDTDLAHLHGALWCSALSGLAGTVMSWWWDDLDKMNVYRLYPPLAAFVDGIPFTDPMLRRFDDTSTDTRRRVVGLQSADAAFLWIDNPQATWWKVAIEKREPQEVTSATVTIQGLNPAVYRAEWWDTYRGTVFKKEDDLKATSGTLRLSVPSFRNDIACKTLRKPAKP